MATNLDILAASDACPAPAAAICSICGGDNLQEVLPDRSVPVYCNKLWHEAAEATRAPRGQLHLFSCGTCGHIQNARFDPSLLEYTPEYENSLHHSTLFSRYAMDLAHHLVAEYRLASKLVVDVGCGRGDFLKLLCRLGGCRGRGYDRSYPAGEQPSASEDVTFVRDFFSRDSECEPIALLCCRQVLEHIPDPAKLLEEIRLCPGVGPDTVLFFEVPNASYTFRDNGIWDLIYEHCSYFNENSLTSLFVRSGYEVIATASLYGGQYLSIEARPKPAGAPDAPPLGKAGTSSDFAARHSAKIERWQQCLAEWTRAGERVVVWGAGSKGVSFLDTVGQSSITHAVDLNPRKWGRYLPGSGAAVVEPKKLTELRPDRVIMMNALYRDEIARELAQLGLSPCLVPA